MRMSSIVQIQTEQLIEAIKNRPCVWKVLHPGYQDKDMKKVAWQAILRELFQDFDSFSTAEMLHLIAETQKKWRNIKDSFTKEITRQIKYKNGQVAKRRTYRYYKQLKFLLANEIHRKESIKVEHSDESSNSQEAATVTFVRDFPLPKIKSVETSKTDSNTGTSQFSPFDPLSVSTSEETTYDVPKIHPDMAFFMSLVPAVQTLDDDQKLVFQMKVLKALRSVKRPRTLNISTKVETDRVYDISELNAEDMSLESDVSFDE